VRSDVTAPKWEYFVAQYTGSIWNSQGEWSQPDIEGFSTEQMLNHFGKQGWELVTIGPVHNNSGAPSAAYIFKRQVI
jgi:hypothetical protein